MAGAAGQVLPPGSERPLLGMLRRFHQEEGKPPGRGVTYFCLPAPDPEEFMLVELSWLLGRAAVNCGVAKGCNGLFWGGFYPK